MTMDNVQNYDGIITYYCHKPVESMTLPVYLFLSEMSRSLLLPVTIVKKCATKWIAKTVTIIESSIKYSINKISIKLVSY
jgi:hypothetical protein